jgi:hypothetical protein
MNDRQRAFFGLASKNKAKVDLAKRVKACVVKKRKMLAPWARGRQMKAGIVVSLNDGNVIFVDRKNDYLQ